MLILGFMPQGTPLLRRKGESIRGILWWTEFRPRIANLLQRDQGNGASASPGWKRGHVSLSDIAGGGINFVDEDGVRACANDDQELTRRIDLKKSGIAYLKYIARCEGASGGVDAVLGNGAGAVVAGVEKLSGRK